MNKLWIYIIILFAVSGCHSFPKKILSEEASITKPSAIYNDFIRLPPPKGKITTAVYNFRDQTGQYKVVGEVNSTFSTMVTQGSTSMLIKVLEESGWFISIEREGISDLINERNIMKTYDKNKKPLSNLLAASILLEGGIIAYETNVKSGGFGAKYLGIGASAQYRRDQVTLILRAVNVDDGRVLKSVSVTKKIFSKQVEGSVFKFISFKSLLEAESGYTSNDPAQQCLYEALEKAVMSLIIEGIIDGLWEMGACENSSLFVIKDYLQEKLKLGLLNQKDISFIKNNLPNFNEKIGFFGIKGITP